jgi:hypothetical protein
MEIFNLHDDEWDRVEERPGWRSKDAHIGKRLGAELLGGSLYELEPGDRLFPYHTHHANEEWLIVVRTDAPIRVLMLSTLIFPEVVEYVDSGKVGARNASGERIMLGRPGPRLDYWDGED